MKLANVTRKHGPYELNGTRILTCYEWNDGLFMAPLILYVPLSAHSLSMPNLSLSPPDEDVYLLLLVSDEEGRTNEYQMIFIHMCTHGICKCVSLQKVTDVTSRLININIKSRDAFIKEVITHLQVKQLVSIYLRHSLSGI